MSTLPHVLLLEDDPAIARVAAYALEREGLTVTHSLLVQAALAQLRGCAFDLLVLDISLPDGNGLDVLRQLRAPAASGAWHTRSTTPVLMLSARGEELDRVLGLELGADDYLTKPFSPRELAARAKALLRRSNTFAAPQTIPPQPPNTAPTPAPTVHHGLHHDSDGQRILLHGQVLPLTRREYHLLAHLMQGPGRIYSRDNLLAAAWGDDTDSTDRTVDTHIKTLRAKLREVHTTHDYITTHRGLGYSLNLAPPA